jgi:hypothetical protein
MNKFGTFLATVLVALVVAAPAFAETDYLALPIIRDIQNGVNNANAIKTLYVSGSVGFAGALNSSGAIATTSDISTSAGDLTVTAGDIITPATSGTATNGAVVTLTSRYTLLAGIGGANDTTNTVTIASPGTAGITRTIMVTRASTNLILIAESEANMDLGAASRELDNLDNLTLYAETTTNWVEVGFVNN